MPRPDSRLGKSTLAFAWFNAFMFIVAASWGSYAASGQLPLAGLRRISEDPFIAWPLAAFSSCVAVQLSVKRLRSRERLLFTSGALACGWLVLALYVSPGPAVGLALLSGMLYRHAATADA
jgi:hypothetical protein